MKKQTGRARVRALTDDQIQELGGLYEACDGSYGLAVSRLDFPVSVRGEVCEDSQDLLAALAEIDWENPEQRIRAMMDLSNKREARERHAQSFVAAHPEIRPNEAIDRDQLRRHIGGAVDDEDLTETARIAGKIVTGVMCPDGRVDEKYERSRSRMVDYLLACDLNVLRQLAYAIPSRYFSLRTVTGRYRMVRANKVLIDCLHCAKVRISSEMRTLEETREDLVRDREYADKFDDELRTYADRSSGSK